MCFDLQRPTSKSVKFRIGLLTQLDRGMLYRSSTTYSPCQHAANQVNCTNVASPIVL